MFSDYLPKIPSKQELQLPAKDFDEASQAFPIQTLPLELIKMIFSQFIEPRALGKIAQTCKRFNELLKEEDIWLTIAKRLSFIIDSNGQIKKQTIRHVILSPPLPLWATLSKDNERIRIDLNSYATNKSPQLANKQEELKQEIKALLDNSKKVVLELLLQLPCLTYVKQVGKTVNYLFKNEKKRNH